MAKGGYGVFKAELRVAEVDPLFRYLTRRKWAIANQSHSGNFGQIALKRIEHGLLYWESRSYSLQSDRTKIGFDESTGSFSWNLVISNSVVSEESYLVDFTIIVCL